jgi:phosphotransferase system HPr (HPr) family protein
MTARSDILGAAFPNLLSLAASARNSLSCASSEGLNSGPSMNDSILIRRNVKLNLEQGLHIRACSTIVAIVGDFGGQIRIHQGDKSADASSMFDLVQLAAPPGTELTLEGNGEGAESILDALETFLSRRTEPDPEQP